MLYLWRTVNRHSLRDLGKEIGVSAATLMRVEHGYGTDAATFVKLLAWMTKP
jgi:transcriptional regulator with XRE-family HTH domain